MSYRRQHKRIAEIVCKILKTYPITLIIRKNLSEHVERKATVSSSEVVYKVQLLTSKKKLSSKDPCFKGLSPISYYEENGWYKYTYGESTRREALSRKLAEAKRYFKDAYIVSFKNGKKLK